MAYLQNLAYAGKQDKTLAHQTPFQAVDLYQALAAEISIQLGDENKAVDYYYKLSASHKDPAVAKRVTELATVTGQIAKALDGAKRWVELEPNDLESNQYLTLLYLRNNHLKAAAKQLDYIRSLIEMTSTKKDISLDIGSKDENNFTTSESLTFIGALLIAEAHHAKAYSVFKLYIEKYASGINKDKTNIKQQRLITAQLAMKAKSYSDVINTLEGLTGLNAQNTVDVAVLHAKALHKSHQNKPAIKLLRSIQNLPEANDSHRLELVRLLVLNTQKDLALPILEKLVKKHSKNLELLKSLISLQIDQSKLSEVLSNISILRTNSKYKNEAEYFAGEFAEKLGQREKALLSYEKVKQGSYLKNAHKKRISLTRKIYGQEALNSFFDDEQKKAETLRDKAYWIKLQADNSFEAKQYKDALTLYNKAIILAPSQTRYHYKRGLVNERMGNLDKAEIDFNFVLEKRENDTDTLNALGYMLSVHTNRYVEAKNYIDKAFQLKPNDPLILDSLGFVLYKTGELQKAEIILRKAFLLMKKPEVASHLITVLAKSNKHQEAKDIYNEMKRIYPESPSLQSVSRYFP